MPQGSETELERQTTHVFLSFLSSTRIGVTGAVGALGRLAFKIAVAISLDSDQLASHRRAHLATSRRFAVSLLRRLPNARNPLLVRVAPSNCLAQRLHYNWDNCSAADLSLKKLREPSTFGIQGTNVKRLRVLHPDRRV